MTSSRPSPRLVSVIVPSYNAGPFLGAQIVALSRQDYAGDVEVVVADNGSRDGSARASAHSPEGVAVRLIDASRRRGPGAARNAGARAARGDFLAFCDADDVVSTTWLRQLVGSASGADLVGGRFEGERLNSPSVRSCYDLADPAAPHLGFLPSASGANLGIWADVFFALGGFDERSRTGEDVALVWKAQLSGYAYVASEALVCKRFPVDLRDAARRFFGYGLGDAWLYRQFRDAGMPRRDRHQTFNLWRALAHGFSGLPREKRHCVWATALALCFGRLAGSARQRVIFT